MHCIESQNIYAFAKTSRQKNQHPKQTITSIPSVDLLVSFQSLNPFTDPLNPVGTAFVPIVFQEDFSNCLLYLFIYLFFNYDLH